jgi:outer membrane protein TolC
MLNLVLALALCAGPQAAGAQDEAPPDQAAPPAPEPVAPLEELAPQAASPDEQAAPPAEAPPADTAGQSREGAPLLHGQLALSLEDALEMGLENNLDVQVERYAPIIADHDESIAWGAYDPELFSEFGYTDSKTPNANVLTSSGGSFVDTSVNRSTDGFGGLRGQLPLLGTEYNARFDSARETTSIIINALNPELSSGWQVDLTQPLLRDLIWNQPWTQVKTSRLLLESSQEDFRRAVMDTVTSIEDAYWALIAQDEARRVAGKSLETSRALLDQTQTQYEVGVVSKVEVTEAQAGLSQREVNLIRAENQYRNQQDVLINLVLGPGLRSSSSLEISPTDRPEEYVPYEIDVATAVERAFDNRPELVAAIKEIERQEVQLKFAKNQRLPALDGIFSVRQAGIGGNPNPDACDFVSRDDPDTLPDENQICRDAAIAAPQVEYDDTFDTYDDNPVYVARARLSIPIPNTSARHSVSKTELQLSRAQTQKRRLEQSIILEVRRAARNLQASQEGIDAARDAQRAAEEQLRAERIRLEYGESTPFDVLQREEQLVDRENELIGAFQAYRTSVTALDRAQGTILRNRNIDIATVGALR